MGKLRIAAILMFVGLLSLSGIMAAASDAPEAWQKEFEEVCSQTQDAMGFTPHQLEGLVRRCDALVPQIEKLDDVHKRVYLPRLRQCRGVFSYVLESKNEPGKK
jgi:Spy/CpxP family protein refolding chaperone